jgi:hypothetical protein
MQAAITAGPALGATAIAVASGILSALITSELKRHELDHRFSLKLLELDRASDNRKLEIRELFRQQHQAETEKQRQADWRNHLKPLYTSASMLSERLTDIELRVRAGSAMIGALKEVKVRAAGSGRGSVSGFRRCTLASLGDDHSLLDGPVFRASETAARRLACPEH